MKRLGVALAIAAIVGFTTPAPLEAQCAMCRSALEGSEQGRAMGEKFNHGILFLLGAPFSVVAGIGIAMARSRRRAPIF